MWPYPQLTKVPILHESVAIRGPCLIKSRRGVAADNVKAEVEARERKSVSEVTSFLGLVNYSWRFIPYLATFTEPLRRLTKKDVEFQWGQGQVEAFQKLKNELARAEILGYCDKDAEIRVIPGADATLWIWAPFSLKNSRDNSGSLCMPVEV